MQKIKNEPGKLRLGVYSKKQKQDNTILTIILFILDLVIFVLCGDDNPLFFVLLILCLFLINFMIIIIVGNKINPIIKIKRELWNTLDINKCIKDINQILETENLHSESVKELKLILVESYTHIDINKANELFSEIEEPYVKNIQSLYYMKKFVLELNNEQFEEAKETYNKFNQEFTEFLYKMNRLSMEYTYKTYLTDEVVDEIEKKLLTNTKNKYINLCNSNGLMDYFYRRNDFEKAKLYANKVLDMNTDFLRFNEAAKNILSNIEN